MDCIAAESFDLKRRLRFNLHGMINIKVKTVLVAIIDVFEKDNMETQYSLLGYRTDPFFHDYNLAIEVDKIRHTDRNIDDEIERQQKCDCKFIRIGPDRSSFNIFKTLSNVHRHIKSFITEL